jgi:AraC-like DNA-binding protein
MLEETDLPLAVVAMRAGYCDQSHLCREIRNVLGLTPRAVRAGHENFCAWAQETSKTG